MMEEVYCGRCEKLMLICINSSKNHSRLSDEVMLELDRHLENDHDPITNVKTMGLLIDKMVELYWYTQPMLSRP
jgi:hypothetical protein